jgi:formylglycine-generating enzyme required for sulfatase activity
MSPEIVIIPAGSFLMGSDRGQENERPVHRVWLDGFAIGKFPVSNRAYKICVEDKAVPPPPFWSEPMFSDPDQPVVGVSWDEAVAYCQWLSQGLGQAFRLPTEAEWERAARGGRESALYPWGDKPPSERPYPGIDSESGGPPRVSDGEPNGFGLYAMSEGVHEWCSDYYDYDYYRHSPETNPQGPAGGQRRSSRGGSWRHRIKFSRCAARSSLPPAFKYADYGFRIAMTI